MKIETAVIDAFIDKLRSECLEPTVINGDDSAALENERNKGVRQGIALCADKLSNVRDLFSK